MRIEYLDKDDIVNIVGTQLDIYDNALKSIITFNVLKGDNSKSLLETYRGLTSAAISSSIADLFDLSNDDHRDLNKRITAVLSDTTLRTVDMKGKVVLIALKYFQKALYDLEEKLADRGQIVKDAANEMDAKINNLEKAVEANIKSN